MQLKKYFVCFAFILSFSSVSKAGVITELDLFSSSDKAMTYVEDTGLNWLDLTYTNGMSYDAVNVDLTLGGLLDSTWRIATLSEVDTLFTAYGFTPDSGCNNGALHCSPSGESLSAAVNMIYQMYAPSGNELKGLFYNPNLSPGYVGKAFTDHGNYGTPGISIDALTDASEASSYSSYSNTGVFLVQTHGAVANVPAPATIFLLIVGLAGIVFRKKLT